MKLKSFKMLKLPLMAICMLAAGICYSCGSRQAISGNEGMVLELTESGEEISHGSEGTIEQGSNTDRITAQGSNAGEIKYHGSESDGAKPAGGQPDGKLAGSVFVHVCGRVREPGVYELPKGSRVYEAIEAAGGFEEDGANDYLNLAGEIQDGMKLEVPAKSQAEQWKAMGVSAKPGQVAGEHAAAKVNINTAGKEELMSLRGIGQSRAEDIIRYREEYGGFGSIEDIMNVSGIKDAAFEKIKDSITV